MAPSCSTEAAVRADAAPGSSDPATAAATAANASSDSSIRSGSNSNSNSDPASPTILTPCTSPDDSDNSDSDSEDDSDSEADPPLGTPLSLLTARLERGFAPHFDIATQRALTPLACPQVRAAAPGLCALVGWRAGPAQERARAAAILDAAAPRTVVGWGTGVVVERFVVDCQVGFLCLRRRERGEGSAIYLICI